MGHQQSHPQPHLRTGQLALLPLQLLAGRRQLPPAFCPALCLAVPGTPCLETLCSEGNRPLPMRAPLLGHPFPSPVKSKGITEVSTAGTRIEPLILSRIWVSSAQISHGAHYITSLLEGGASSAQHPPQYPLGVAQQHHPLLPPQGYSGVSSIPCLSITHVNCSSLTGHVSTVTGQIGRWYVCSMHASRTGAASEHMWRR